MPKKAGILTLEESKMTVDLTLNDMTIENANAVLALLLGRRSTEEKGAAEKAPAPDDGIPLFDAPPSAAEDLAEETADEPSYTIEQVRAAFTKYAKQNGKEAAKKMLEKFDAGKVTEIKAGDYAAVMKAVG